jgi:uncharacterized protein YuzB (UPF0349 family)
MNVVVALAIGYMIGTKTRTQEFDDVRRSLKALYGTDEFADLVAAGRAHLGATLHDLAALVDGQTLVRETGEDLVAQVRHLVERS